MTLRASALAVAAAATLAGCGGGEAQERASAPVRAPPASLQPSLPFDPSQLQVRKLAYIPEAPAPAPQRAAATSHEAQFHVEDEAGRRVGTFVLAPEFGKGYAPLRLVMLARRIGDTAPAAPVRAACQSTTRCEYDLGARYVVDLGGGEAELVARDDHLALVVRTLRVEQDRTVTIRLLKDGQLALQRQVVLLSQRPPPAHAGDAPSVKRIDYLK